MQRKQKNRSNYDEALFKRAKEIYNQFQSFTNGVRVLFLIHRNKEGGETNNTKVLKVISQDEEQYLDRIYELLVEKSRRPEPLRIYASVNHRNLQKAERHFKQSMLDNDYADDETHEQFYLHIWARWISSLMKPQNRGNTYFLIDCDSQEEYDEAMNEISTAQCANRRQLYVTDFPTKSGRHIITYQIGRAHV